LKSTKSAKASIESRTWTAEFTGHSSDAGINLPCLRTFDMQHILHIVPRLHLGDTAKELVLLGQGLSKSEFRQSVYVLAGTKPGFEALNRADIDATMIGSRGEFDAVALWRLVRSVQKLAPSIIHVWPPIDDIHAWAATRLAGTGQLVVTMPALGDCSLEVPPFYRKSLIMRANRVIVSSMAMRDCLISKGLRSEKVVVISRGVNVVEPRATPRNELLAELGLLPNAKLIGYLGSLRKEKRLKELIWAIDQLKAVDVPAHLLLIGEGPMRSALERYRWLNRVDDRVHFLGPRQDAFRFLPHCEVLWQAGAYQGHSRAILEAMANGIPVVAVDSPGNRELVVHGRTGYLAPLGERAGLARWTLPMLEEPGRAAEFGAAARQMVLEHHRLDAMLENYERMYRDSFE
jgi:glycosyltransferase involved in cell wall biosynthesis